MQPSVPSVHPPSELPSTGPESPPLLDPDPLLLPLPLLDPLLDPDPLPLSDPELPPLLDPELPPLPLLDPLLASEPVPVSGASWWSWMPRIELQPAAAAHTRRRTLALRITRSLSAEGRRGRCPLARSRPPSSAP
jgi:hypothetical protein